MKFSLIYEISLPIDTKGSGKPQSDAFWEAIEQIKLADELGFHCVWVPEHHFLEDLSLSSAPEIFLSAVAQHTSKIRMGHGVVLMPPPFSHPFRIAERIATLDILSRGRVEFGCGRSVTEAELGGYGVPPAQSRPMMQEAMRVVPQMWRNPDFPGYKGEHIDIPPRTVVPQPVQKPHPPMWMACGSSTSFRTAGEMGVGCLSFTAASPAELDRRLQTYREGIAEARPVGDFVNNQVACFTTLYLDEDDRAARDWGGPNAIRQMGRITKYFGNVAQQPGYEEYSAALHERKGIAEAQVDPRVMAEEFIAAKRTCVGDPDAVEAIIREYEAIGVDQFMGMVQFGNISHEQSMKTIRLMGEKVMPRFS